MLVPPASDALAEGILARARRTRCGARQLAAAARRLRGASFRMEPIRGLGRRALRGGGAACQRRRRAERIVSVVIPARNEGPNDRAPDRGGSVAGAAGLDDPGAPGGRRLDRRHGGRRAHGGRARVELGDRPGGGNPAVARNRGARAAARRSAGLPRCRLPARRPAGWRDCSPRHDGGGRGGRRLARPAGRARADGAVRLLLRLVSRPLPPAGGRGSQSPARQPQRPARPPFSRPPGFTEQQPVAYAHEELAWQAAVRRAGGRIVFDPRAMVVPLQPAGLPQPAAPQLPLGLQRDREQGADRRGAHGLGVSLSGAARGGRPAARARQRGLHHLVLGCGPACSSRCSCSRSCSPPGWPTPRGWWPAGSDGCGSVPARRRRGPDGNDRRTSRERRDLHPRPDRDSSARALDSLARAAPGARGDHGGGQRAAGRRDARPRRHAVSPASRYVREPVQGLDFARNRALADGERRRGRVPRRRRGGRPRDGRPRSAPCSRRTRRSSCAPAGSRRSADGTEGERCSRPTAASRRGAGRVRLPGDAGRPLHGRSAPLIAWAVSVGQRLQLRRPPDGGARARRVRRGARSRRRAAGRRRPRPALAGAPGGTRGGLRAGRARLARAPRAGRRGARPDRRVISARCSRS